MLFTFLNPKTGSHFSGKVNSPGSHHQANVPGAAATSPGCGANCEGVPMAGSVDKVKYRLDRKRAEP